MGLFEDNAQTDAACINGVAVGAANATASFGWQGGDAACEHVDCGRSYEVCLEIDDSRPPVLVGAVFALEPATPREIAVLAVCDCGAKALMGRERYAAGVRSGFAPDRCYAKRGF